MVSPVWTLVVLAGFQLCCCQTPSSDVSIQASRDVSTSIEPSSTVSDGVAFSIAPTRVLEYSSIPSSNQEQTYSTSANGGTAMTLVSPASLISSSFGDPGHDSNTIIQSVSLSASVSIQYVYTSSSLMGYSPTSERVSESMMQSDTTSVLPARTLDTSAYSRVIIPTSLDSSSVIEHSGTSELNRMTTNTTVSSLSLTELPSYVSPFSETLSLSRKSFSVTRVFGSTQESTITTLTNEQSSKIPSSFPSEAVTVISSIFPTTVVDSLVISNDMSSSFMSEISVLLNINSYDSQSQSYYTLTSDITDSRQFDTLSPTNMLSSKPSKTISSSYLTGSTTQQLYTSENSFSAPESMHIRVTPRLTSSSSTTYNSVVHSVTSTFLTSHADVQLVSAITSSILQSSVTSATQLLYATATTDSLPTSLISNAVTLAVVSTLQVAPSGMTSTYSASRTPLDESSFQPGLTFSVTPSYSDDQTIEVSVSRMEFDFISTSSPEYKLTSVVDNQFSEVASTPATLQTSVAETVSTETNDSVFKSNTGYEYSTLNPSTNTAFIITSKPDYTTTPLNDIALSTTRLNLNPSTSSPEYKLTSVVDNNFSEVTSTAATLQTSVAETVSTEINDSVFKSNTGYEYRTLNPSTNTAFIITSKPDYTTTPLNDITLSTTRLDLNPSTLNTLETGTRLSVSSNSISQSEISTVSSIFQTQYFSIGINTPSSMSLSSEYIGITDSLLTFINQTVDPSLQSSIANTLAHSDYYTSTINYTSLRDDSSELITATYTMHSDITPANSSTTTSLSMRYVTPIYSETEKQSIKETHTQTTNYVSSTIKTYDFITPSISSAVYSLEYTVSSIFEYIATTETVSATLFSKKYITSSIVNTGSSNSKITDSSVSRSLPYQTSVLDISPVSNYVETSVSLTVSPTTDIFPSSASRFVDIESTETTTTHVESPVTQSSMVQSSIQVPYTYSSYSLTTDILDTQFVGVSIVSMMSSSESSELTEKVVPTHVESSIKPYSSSQYVSMSGYIPFDTSITADTSLQTNVFEFNTSQPYLTISEIVKSEPSEMKTTYTKPNLSASMTLVPSFQSDVSSSDVSSRYTEESVTLTDMFYTFNTTSDTYTNVLESTSVVTGISKSPESVYKTGTYSSSSERSIRISTDFYSLSPSKAEITTNVTAFQGSMMSTISLASTGTPIEVYPYSSIISEQLSLSASDEQIISLNSLPTPIGSITSSNKYSSFKISQTQSLSIFSTQYFSSSQLPTQSTMISEPRSNTLIDASLSLTESSTFSSVFLSETDSITLSIIPSIQTNTDHLTITSKLTLSTQYLPTILTSSPFTTAFQQRDSTTIELHPPSTSSPPSTASRSEPSSLPTKHVTHISALSGTLLPVTSDSGSSIAPTGWTSSETPLPSAIHTPAYSLTATGNFGTASSLRNAASAAPSASMGFVPSSILQSATAAISSSEQITTSSYDLTPTTRFSSNTHATLQMPSLTNYTSDLSSSLFVQQSDVANSLTSETLYTSLKMSIVPSIDSVPSSTSSHFVQQTDITKRLTSQTMHTSLKTSIVPSIESVSSLTSSPFVHQSDITNSLTSQTMYTSLETSIVPSIDSVSSLTSSHFVQQSYITNSLTSQTLYTSLKTSIVHSIDSMSTSISSLFMQQSDTTKGLTGQTMYTSIVPSIDSVSLLTSSHFVQQSDITNSLTSQTMYASLKTSIMPSTDSGMSSSASHFVQQSDITNSLTSLTSYTSLKMSTLPSIDIAMSSSASYFAHQSDITNSLTSQIIITSLQKSSVHSIDSTISSSVSYFMQQSDSTNSFNSKSIYASLKASIIPSIYSASSSTSLPFAQQSDITKSLTSQTMHTSLKKSIVPSIDTVSSLTSSSVVQQSYITNSLTSQTMYTSLKMSIVPSIDSLSSSTSSHFVQQSDITNSLTSQTMYASLKTSIMPSTDSGMSLKMSTLASIDSTISSSASYFMQQSDIMNSLTSKTMYASLQTSTVPSIDSAISSSASHFVRQSTITHALLPSISITSVSDSRALISSSLPSRTLQLSSVPSQTSSLISLWTTTSSVSKLPAISTSLSDSLDSVVFTSMFSHEPLITRITDSTYSLSTDASVLSTVATTSISFSIASLSSSLAIMESVTLPSTIIPASTTIRIIPALSTTSVPSIRPQRSTAVLKTISSSALPVYTSATEVIPSSTLASIISVATTASAFSVNPSTSLINMSTSTRSIVTKTAATSIESIYQFSSTQLVNTSVLTSSLTSSINSTSISSTTINATSEVQTTTIAPTSVTTVTSSVAAPTTESPTGTTVNASTAGESYWVETKLKVQKGTDVTGSAFKTDLELRLADAYNEAFIRKKLLAEGKFEPLQRRRRRRKRATTVGQATVDVRQVIRDPGTIIVTAAYAVAKNGTVLPAADAVGSLDVMTTQELAIILRQVVDSKADSFIKVDEPTDGDKDGSQLLIIALVAGPIAGGLIIIWILVCVYIKCCRHKAYTTEEPELTGIKEQTDKERKPHLSGTSNPLFNSTDEICPKKPKHSPAKKGRSYEMSQPFDSPKRKSKEQDVIINPLTSPTKQSYRPQPSPPSTDGSPKKVTPKSSTQREYAAPVKEAATSKQNSRSPKKSIKPTSPRKNSLASYGHDPSYEEVFPQNVAESHLMQPRMMEKDEELLERQRRERRKNKDRLRKKRQKERGEFPTDQAAITYGRKPSVTGKPPEVFIDSGSSKKQAKLVRQDSGVSNEPLSGDETLEEARQRMHMLLDDAFTLISPRNSFVEQGDRRGSSQYQLSPAITSSTVHISQPPDPVIDKGKGSGHEPTFSNPAFDSECYNDFPLETWSPYRSTDKMTLISMPHLVDTKLGGKKANTNRPTTPKPARRPAATLDAPPSKSTGHMLDSKYTSNPPKPIVLRTKELMNNVEKEYEQFNKKPSVQKTASNGNRKYSVTGINGDITESTTSFLKPRNKGVPNGNRTQKGGKSSTRTQRASSIALKPVDDVGFEPTEDILLSLRNDLEVLKEQYGSGGSEKKKSKRRAAKSMTEIV